MIHTEIIGNNENAVVVLYKYENFQGQKTSVIRRFENKVEAYRYYLIFSRDYVVQNFDQIRQIAFHVGMSVPQWTNEVGELEISEVCKDVLTKAMRWNISHTRVDIHNYLQTRIINIRHALRRMKSTLQKMNTIQVAIMDKKNEEDE